MYAFDADVLIYAAVRDHPMGRRVRSLLELAAAGAPAGVGSTLLLPEILAKPMRLGAREAVAALTSLLAGLELRPADHSVATVATALDARYGSRAADAVHLATGVVAGCDRFVTSNRRDFPASIAEIAVTYPSELPEP